MLRAIFLLCLTVAVYGGHPGHGGASAHDAGGNSTGDCNDEIQVCTDCILESVKKNQDRVMEQFKNKKSELEACFTANNCKVPQPKNHTVDPDAMKKMKCGFAMMKKGMDSVVECVKKDFPDFKMPHFNFSGMHQFHPEQLCGVLNESCGTEGNRTEVTRCLFKTFMGNVTALKNDHNQFCSEANHCVAKMSKKCENEFFKVKEVGEKCAENLMKNPGNFTQGITECEGVDLKSQAQGQCSFGSHGAPQGGKSGKGSGQKPEKKKNPRNICGSFDDHRDSHFSYGHSESGH